MNSEDNEKILDLLNMLVDENNELQDRIVKAIKYIEAENSIDNEIEYTTRLLDILRGKDNEFKKSN